MIDPWFKSTLPHTALGAKLKLAVPHEVFSTQRIDEGTILLLENLPTRAPTSVLDMGCGYGALGLPIAALYPNARVEMVDRDLLAVKWSAHNARAHGLSNVHAQGSLGYRDLKRPEQTPHLAPRYDWILCNVPARIGRPFIENLLESGRRLLNPGGELRVVIINDLVSVHLELASLHDWPLIEIIRGPRHSIFSLAPSPGELRPEPVDLYLRDQVDLQGLALDRPFDLGGDDPKRLNSGLPTLLDALPRNFRGRAFCFRSGYGQVPLTARRRWPEARIVATDRDLLGTHYVRRNAERLQLGGEKLEVRETSTFQEALAPQERFELILGELSPSAGEKVALTELQAIHSALEPNGEALILALEKLEREWIKPSLVRTLLSIQPIIRREGYVVLTMRGR